MVFGDHFSRINRRTDHTTPFDFYNELDNVFKFDCDPCTDKLNRLGTKIFWTKKENGLKQEWGKCSFVNPPYGDHTRVWIAKSIEQAHKNKKVVMLIASRTGSSYWYDLIYPNARAVCYMRGRLKFSGMDTAPKFDSCIVVFVGAKMGLTSRQLELLEVKGHVEILNIGR